MLKVLKDFAEAVFLGVAWTPYSTPRMSI